MSNWLVMTRMKEMTQDMPVLHIDKMIYCRQYKLVNTLCNIFSFVGYAAHQGMTIFYDIARPLRLEE